MRLAAAILAILIAGVFGPRALAQQQIACTAQVPVNVLNSFSDYSPISSITPRTMRNFACSTTLTIPNISQLRTNTVAPASINVLGFMTAGDGGGAIYNYNPIDHTTPDNGTTVIVDQAAHRWFKSGTGSPVYFASTVASLKALQVSAATSGGAVILQGYRVIGDIPSVPYTLSMSACTLNSGAGDGGSQIPRTAGGCWLIAAQTVYDVRWWGADNTAVTSSTTAINRAAAYVGSIGGGTVYMPGDYLIDGAGAVVSGAGVTLSGVGNWGNTNATAATNVLCRTGDNKCLTFNGSGDYLKNVAIDATAGMNLGVYIVAFDGGSTTPIYGTGISNVYATGQASPSDGSVAGPNGIYLHAILVHTEDNVRMGQFASGQQIVFMDGTDGTTSVQDVSFHRVNFSAKGIQGATSDTTSILIDGWVKSVVFEDAGIGLGSRYGIWMKNSAPTASGPGFIYVYGRGQEDGFSAPINVDALDDSLMLTDVYLSTDGEDPDLDVGTGVVGSIFVTGSTLRGSGRDGIRSAGGNIFVTGSAISDNGAYANSAYNLTVTGAANDGTGKCAIAWTSSLAPSFNWTPRTGDIVTVASIAGAANCNATDIIRVTDTTHFSMVTTSIGGQTYSSGGTAELAPSNVRLRTSTGTQRFVMSGGQAGALPGLNRALYGVTIDASVPNSTFTGVDMCGNQIGPLLNNSSDTNTSFSNIQCALPQASYAGVVSGTLSSSPTTLYPFSNAGFVAGHKIAITAVTGLVGTGTNATVQLVVNGTAVGSGVAMTTTGTTTTITPIIVDGTVSPASITFRITAITGTPANLSVQYAYKVLS